MRSTGLAVANLARVVVAIDPAITSGEESDETGIIVAGLGFDGRGYVMADLTLRANPIEWARKEGELEFVGHDSSTGNLELEFKDPGGTMHWISVNPQDVVAIRA